MLNAAVETERLESPARLWAAYAAPFATFIAFMTLDKAAGPAVWSYPFRVVVVAALLIWLSRRLPWRRPSHWLASALLGVAIYVIWVGPDVLWPAYRHHWLFQNSIVGKLGSTVPEAVRSNPVFIVFRVLGCAAIVPPMEELLWRGCLMRWLIKPEFWDVPLGTYAAKAFWLTALLFASEHGPYWEVGLVAGVLYGWWCVKTRNLSDCVLAHAVTNACLSAHVLITGHWQYWS